VIIINYASVIIGNNVFIGIGSKVMFDVKMTSIELIVPGEF